ncbi:hypothetical protein B0T26DRAFT_645418 [Lasiosphaeria miniovina]|uniref:F-box domain-containing protein n=1 Tax=Lasiosphaeria miniovina TaxID=1954250 RepID=A0AA40AKS5_9PEZI|nr:uncharacterized protein B0T26DRAFT_645418 [Lasiosphaeria miniovina]KAK0717671.1 hypothetical protein B0T26DRAFT_645418 [Lasiosphaeria miniovina]
MTTPLSLPTQAPLSDGSDAKFSLARPAARLESMPTEIIDMILDCLVPQPPELGETRPVSYAKLVPGEAWYSLTRNRRGLCSLCLVSRRWAAAARPLLYRVLTILDEDAVVLLFRTLVETPSYGTWARFLSCHLTLTSEPVIREARRAISRLLRSCKPATELAAIVDRIGNLLSLIDMILPNLNASASVCHDDLQRMLFLILMLLPRLETLFLQLPISDKEPCYATLLNDLKRFSKSCVHTCKDPDLVPLHKVGTLLLQGDPEVQAHFERNDCHCDLDHVYGARFSHYWPLYDALPNLKTLEVSVDDGCWINAAPGRDGGDDLYLAKIRHIYLHNSVTSPIDLHHLLHNAPNLETLYMTPRREWDTDYGVDPGDLSLGDPESLDAALVQHKNLRHLDVGWHTLAGYESLLGPEGRLKSLPELRRLEKLCVQLAALYRPLPGTHATPLADLLPPNLVELTLEDYWWFNIHHFDAMDDWQPQDMILYYQNCHNYRVKFLDMFTQFARDAGERFPRLKKVRLLCKIPQTWMMNSTEVNLDFHFEDVRTLFRAQDVKFFVLS